MNALGLFACAALLRQGRTLDGLATVLSIQTLVGLTLLATHVRTAHSGVLAGALLLALGFGLLEKYWAMRVAFDAALVLRMAEAGERLDAQTLELDRGLQALHLLPPHKAGRDWSARSEGALRLLKRQGYALLGQLMGLLAALGVLFFG